MSSNCAAQRGSLAHDYRAVMPFRSRAKFGEFVAPLRIAAAVCALSVASAGLFAWPATDAFATSGPPAGSKVPGAIVPVGHVHSGRPYSSGQTVEVQIPPNSVFQPYGGVRILECSAPGGVIPASIVSCDGDTIQGPTVLIKTDGSIDFADYQIYATPDGAIGDTKDGPECDLHVKCVIYIGQNQEDFTKPHFWSEPFSVAPDNGDTGANPGDGTLESQVSSGSGAVPEVIAGLSVVALIVVTAVIVVKRRTESQAKVG